MSISTKAQYNLIAKARKLSKEAWKSLKEADKMQKASENWTMTLHK